MLNIFQIRLQSFHETPQTGIPTLYDATLENPQFVERFKIET